MSQRLRPEAARAVGRLGASRRISWASSMSERAKGSRRARLHAAEGDQTRVPASSGLSLKPLQVSRSSLVDVGHSLRHRFRK